MTDSVADRAASTANDMPDRARATTRRLERLIERHRRVIEVFTRVGWLAKGLVYVLFGVTAIAIAQQSAPTDEASPQGALGQVMDAPAGRLMLGIVAVGLLLYCAWRAFSVALVDGQDAHAWGDRIGYSFSAVFYLTLAITAASSALSGVEPGESNTVESASRRLLENDAGRWALGIGGLVTIAVGLYFVIRKGIMRRFADDLRGIERDVGAHDGVDHWIWVSGLVGWIGRGVVTALVGLSVVQAAITFDSDEAQGFDRALREATTTTTGSVLVWISAIGLIAYGVFCLLSHRRQKLGDTL